MSYVGMDLHSKESHLCLLADNGEVVERAIIKSTRTAIRAWFSGRDDLVVAVEVSGSSPWVYRLLVELGHLVYVVNPRRVKLIAAAKLKTDKVDAETLARLVRLDPDFLAPVQHRSEETQKVRTLLGARRALVEVRTKLINLVRGQLRAYGHKLPGCRSKVFHDAWLAAMPTLPEDLVAILMAVVDQIECATWQIDEYDKRVLELTKGDEVMERLMEVPGVGQTIVLAYVSCIEDPRRFAKSRDVGPYLGFTPVLRQSADVSRSGGITKNGDTYLRQLLVQGAHCIFNSKKDSELKRTAERLEARIGKKCERGLRPAPIR